MGGPIHYIALDETGTKLALSYGSDVAVVEQHTICRSYLTPTQRKSRTYCGSRLDECEKPS